MALVQLDIDAGLIQKTGVIANSVFLPPASVAWEVRSLHAIYVSGATVGNRNLELRLLSGGSVIGRVPVGATQAASLTRTYMFYPGAVDLTAFRDTDFIMTPIPYWFVDASMSLQLVDNKAIAAADTCTSNLQVAQYPNA